MITTETKTKKHNIYYIYEKKLVGVFDDDIITNIYLDKLKNENPDSHFELVIGVEWKLNHKK